jgi:PadR family transcriptional regulator PadR
MLSSPLTSRAAVLEILARGETYGLSILDQFKRRTSGKVRIYQGSLYPLLRDLEKEKLVASRVGEAADRGGRPRVYYKLTAAGRRAAVSCRKLTLGFYKKKGGRR